MLWWYAVYKLSGTLPLPLVCIHLHVPTPPLLQWSCELLSTTHVTLLIHNAYRMYFHLIPGSLLLFALSIHLPIGIQGGTHTSVLWSWQSYHNEPRKKSQNTLAYNLACTVTIKTVLKARYTSAGSFIITTMNCKQHPSESLCVIFVLTLFQSRYIMKFSQRNATMVTYK